MTDIQRLADELEALTNMDLERLADCLGDTATRIAGALGFDEDEFWEFDDDD